MPKSIRVVVVLVVGIIGAAAQAQPLRSELALLGPGQAFAPADEVAVQFTLTNASNNHLYVLRYQTPLAGFENNLFEVRCDDEPVAYIGKLAFRLGPTVEDWIRLEPGESLSTVVDLASVYDMRRSCVYTVRYRAFQNLARVASEAALPVVRPRGPQGGYVEAEMPAEFQIVESDPLTLEVAGTCAAGDVCGVEASVGVPDLAATAPEPVSGIAPAASYGCSSSNLSVLASAKSTGRSQASRAYNDLYYYGANSSLYRTWFGVYTSSRFSTTYGNFSRTVSTLGYGYDYDCYTCPPRSGYIAYVYPHIPYYIYICPQFWGLDSSTKGAVMVHETTHWNVVAGTDDYTYGYSQCQSLARTSPDYAIWNADNYRFAAQYAR